MPIHFEVEYVHPKKPDRHIIAKLLNLTKEFALKERSYLGTVEIKCEFTQPRAATPDGKLRQDLYIYWAKRGNEIPLFKVGDIVELSSGL